MRVCGTYDLTITIQRPSISAQKLAIFDFYLQNSGIIYNLSFEQIMEKDQAKQISYNNLFLFLYS